MQNFSTKLILDLKKKKKKYNSMNIRHLNLMFHMQMVCRRRYNSELPHSKNEKKDAYLSKESGTLAIKYEANSTYRYSTNSI